MEAIAPGRSRDLAISDFVDLDEIDPLFFQKTYWLAPTAKEYRRPYALLLAAMTRTNRAAIGTFVMRGNQYLALTGPPTKIRPRPALRTGPDLVGNTGIEPVTLP